MATLPLGTKVTKSRYVKQRQCVQVHMDLIVDEVTYHQLLTGRYPLLSKYSPGMRELRRMRRGR